MRPLPSLAAILAVALALISASAVRHFVPGLKAATRGTPSVMRESVERARRSSNDQAETTSRPGRPGAVAYVYRLVRRLKWSHPVSNAEPVGAPPGAFALGTSILRRKRWSALGGHGRHGPGATS